MNIKDLDKTKKYYIISDDEAVQIKVLNRLEEHGYTWSDGKPATTYVPINRQKGNIIFLYPNEGVITWARTGTCEMAEENIELKPNDLIKTIVI